MYGNSCPCKYVCVTSLINEMSTLEPIKGINKDYIIVLVVPSLEKMLVMVEKHVLNSMNFYCWCVRSASMRLLWTTLINKKTWYYVNTSIIHTTVILVQCILNNSTTIIMWTTWQYSICPWGNYIKQLKELYAT